MPKCASKKSEVVNGNINNKYFKLNIRCILDITTPDLVLYFNVNLPLTS